MSFSLLPLCMAIRDIIKNDLKNSVTISGLASLTGIGESRMRLIFIHGVKPTAGERLEIRRALKLISDTINGELLRLGE